MQMQALDSRIASQQSQRDQAKTDFDRAAELQRRGVGTQTQLDQAKTNLDVAERNLAAMRGDRSVIAQQATEGAVLCAGRRAGADRARLRGAVVLPGETIATFAEDQYILRLQLPERHAQFLRAGDAVRIGARGMQSEAHETDARGQGAHRLSRDPGRPRDRRRRGGGPWAIISSASALASISTRASGETIVVPAAYVYRRAGVNYVRLAERRRSRRADRRSQRRRRSRGRRDPRGSQGRRQAGGAMKLGLSGVLTRTFINSPLTPLLLIAALVAGALAVVSLPREEEPQISVPMVDIIVAANGYKADEAVELVTRPLEDIVKGINGVEHVYSQTQDDQVVVTARFLVGTDEDTAVLRVHEKIRAASRPHSQGHSRAADRRARHQRRRDPRAHPFGQADKAGEWTDNGLYQVAEELQHELDQGRRRRRNLSRRRQPERNPRRARPREARALWRDAGAGDRQGRRTPTAPSSPARSARTGVASRSSRGRRLQGVPDIGLLLLTTRDGRPGLCQGRRRCRRRRGRTRPSRLDDDARSRPAALNAARR